MLVYSAMWQGRGLLPWLLNEGVHPDCKSYPGDNTPLMQAAADGDLESMRLLLDHGADPNARNENNELPLGFAGSYGQWEAAKLLVERGADVNGIEREGRTHLEWLTYCSNEPGIQVLRSLGGVLSAELDRKNDM